MEMRIRRDTSTAITPPLPQAGGYVVVVVIGLIFAFGMLFTAQCHLHAVMADTPSLAMVFVTKILKKATGEDNAKTEMYDIITCIVGQYSLFQVHHSKPKCWKRTHGTSCHLGQ